MFEKKYKINNTRRHKRLYVDYLIKYRIARSKDQEFLFSNLKDISAGGVKFWTESPLSEGTLLMVEVLVIPIDRVIRGLARVVRVRKTKKSPVYYDALQFMEISAEDQKVLNSFIERIAAESGGRLLVPEPPVVSRRIRARPEVS